MKNKYLAMNVYNVNVLRMYKGVFVIELYSAQINIEVNITYWKYKQIKSYFINQIWLQQLKYSCFRLNEFSL